MLKVEGTTLHDALLADIRSKIVSGKWSPGHRIPFEMELAESYGVSRMTMNKVLSQLTREGFLERRRKLGTVVKLPNVQSAILEITDTEREITSLGLVYSYTLLKRSIRKQSEDDFPGFAFSRGTQVLDLECLHFADESPFCSEDRVINLSAVPLARDADFSIEAPSHWLLRQVPWNSARHTISAVNAAQALARRLQVNTGTACLIVHRVTEWDGTCITATRIAYPGNRHQMVAEFAPRATRLAHQP